MSEPREANHGADSLRVVALSQVPPPQRLDLLREYEREVYAPAFPDASLREDPLYWLRLLDDKPAPPQPLIEVVLLLDDAGTPLGGVTVEFYRAANCGLLTYLAVHPAQRERGVGRRLVALAREHLTRMAGSEVPMFAETERVEDAATIDERQATLVRQRRLSALGARQVVFDYVMPPLREDARTHTLLLLLFDSAHQTARISASVVGALLAELASALGTALDAHPDTASMAARLAAAGQLTVEGLEPPDLLLDECPYFSAIGRASIAFAVEIPQADPPCAFRVSQVYRAIFGTEQRLNPREKQRTEALFASSRSFLDDITTGDPGVNGRPMLLAAQAGADGPIRHPLVLERPALWSYEFEGLDVALAVHDERRELQLAFNEHLCVFESGRMLYVLVIGDDATAGDRLDEYALIQMQQMTVDPWRTSNGNYLGFRTGTKQASGGGSASLHEFVRKRLAALSAAGKDTGADAPASALRDVLHRFGILEGALKLGAHDAYLNVQNALLMIEDEEVFAAARHAFEFYSMDAGAQSAWSGAAQPPKWVEADRRWRTGIEAARCHTIEGFDSEIEERPIPRPLKAFAGLAQAVPDFPRVDESELHDSTRPISVGPQSLFYNHPAVQLEVGVQWRTFREAQAEIGACPYALLTWLIAVHDELIVSDMEARIERMLLGAVEADTPLHEIGPTRPMRDLDTVMKRLRDPWPSSDRLVDDNLGARIDIFRWCSIHRSGNIFRYPTERDLLANINAARGTGERFENAHQMLDRFESLIEDVSALASFYSSRNTNFLLSAITVFGILQLVPLVDNMKAMGVGNAIGRVLVIALILLLIFALWRWITQLRRSRKSS